MRRLAPGIAPYRWEYAKDGRDFDVAVNPQVTSNAMLLMVRIALVGGGITFGIEETFRPWLDSGQLVALLRVNSRGFGQLRPRAHHGRADRIEAPVFLAAGGRDERTSLEHSKRMEKALENAGVPVETLYFPSESHGLYTEPHRREFYTRLLDFLGRHPGGATAAGHVRTDTL